MFKRFSIYKRVAMFSGFCDLMFIFLLYCGYKTASKIRDCSSNTEMMENYIKYFNYFCMIMFVVLAVMMTIFTMAILGGLRKGFKTVTEATMSLAQGDTNHIDLDSYDIKDEFAELINEYKLLVEATKKQADISENVAQGNLTIEVVPRSNNDDLGNALKKMVETNQHTLSNINESAFQVMTSASQVASASEALAQGSTEQASAIEEITSSIADIAEKTKLNASQANDAAGLVNNAITSVKQGNEQMRGMISAMEDINASSESISKIIKVIDDIAFQTNILALNAAVEAARAGEAGKGFAVVAEEVRNLAAKSAQAAAETAELIEDSISKVDAGSKIADDTANALEIITEDVSKSEILINGIAESSNYQATAVAQINQAINQVSQVVQTNSATSQECAAASEELSNQAVHMREMLSIFNLGDSLRDDELIIDKEPSNCRYEKEISLEEVPELISTPNVNTSNEDIISLDDGFGKY